MENIPLHKTRTYNNPTNKNRLLLRTCHPILLLITDYNLIAKCLVLRFYNILHTTINNDQTGYIKGYFTSETTLPYHIPLLIPNNLKYFPLHTVLIVLSLINIEKCFNSQYLK